MRPLLLDTIACRHPADATSAATVKARHVGKPSLGCRRLPACVVLLVVVSRMTASLRDQGEVHVPLARIFGDPGPAGRPALQACSFPDRSKSPLAARGRNHQWRRFWHRLVRREEFSGALQEYGAGVERPQLPGAGAARPCRSGLCPYPCVDRNSGPADQLSPVSVRPMDLDAQWLDRAISG